MNGTEAHEQRLSALMRLTNTKDTFTKLACEFLLGRNVEVEEVQQALRSVEDCADGARGVGRCGMTKRTARSPADALASTLERLFVKDERKQKPRVRKCGFANCNVFTIRDRCHPSSQMRATNETGPVRLSE